MRLRASDIADLVGGTLHGPDVEVVGASADSRELRPGQLFVPVVAERDGHLFIEQALASGAAAYFTAQEPTGAGTAIEVADTLDALTELARQVRPRLGHRVIGVTGSAGKTTVKDLLAAVLATTYLTAASVKSHNNELGVPLTIVNAPDGAEAAVIEMGARGAGHIRHLCDIAQPDVGVVTTLGLAHAEQFGDLDKIATAKAELVEALPGAGTAILNADVPEVAAMAARTSASVLTFGVESPADVVASEIHLDDLLRPRFRFDSPWGHGELVLTVPGRHQIANALAALAAALTVGVDLDQAVAGFAAAELSPWRMDLRVTEGGARVLNDAYNANPLSMRSALESLASLPAERRCAVLGLMAELGEHEDAAHLEIAEHALALGFDVIAVGAPAYGPDVRHVDDLDGAVSLLTPLAATDAVLVKGSRVARLERLVDRLLET